MRKLCLLTLMILAVVAGAHEEHKQTRPAQTGPVTKKPETPAATATPVEDMEEGAEEEEREMPRFSEELFNHPHNKIVHFPLAFGIAGAIFVFVSLKKPEMMTAVRILWLLAALASVGAYFSGESQEEPFEKGALHEVVEQHEKLGIATGISLGIGFIISMIRRLRSLAVFWAIVVFALILVTGYYGGVLAHGH
jgi:uncharacterized membrane protein